MLLSACFCRFTQALPPLPHRKDPARMSRVTAGRALCLRSSTSFFVSIPFLHRSPVLLFCLFYTAFNRPQSEKHLSLRKSIKNRLPAAHENKPVVFRCCMSLACYVTLNEIFMSAEAFEIPVIGVTPAPNAAALLCAASVLLMRAAEPASRETTPSFADCSIRF